MTTILDQIFERKRARVANEKRSVDERQLLKQALQMRSAAVPFGLRAALERDDRINVIAEFKRSSPSKGVINGMSDPIETAQAYATGGASAISVLTEEDHFGGSLEDLRSIRGATTLPILRKDFIFDEFQLNQAAASGADAILLIVAMLGVEELKSLMIIAEEELALDAVVEVHNSEEMEIAKSIGATLIGVNNRNLKSFDVSLDVSRELIGHAPSNSVLIAESGLKTREDLVELRTLGYSGFLIGETLMRSGDPANELRALTAV